MEGEIRWRYITDAAEASDSLGRLEGEAVVGLDTETYWDAAEKRARVSLVQVAPAAGEVLVVDALATGVEPLRALVESPGWRMVAHNARFDEQVLLDAGLNPQGFIDTLRMSRMALSLSSHALAAVTEHLLGLPLDKTLQKSNWRRRPLTRSQLTYAATDARVTLQVYEELRRLLEQEGRFEQALRVATLAPPAAGPRKPRQKRVSAAPPITLTAEEKRIVARLKSWRLELAHAQRIPAYMVCPDRTLEHLVRERPCTLEALAAIHGLGASKIERYGEDLLRALGEASSG